MPSLTDLILEGVKDLLVQFGPTLLADAMAEASKILHHGAPAPSDELDLDKYFEEAKAAADAALVELNAANAAVSETVRTSSGWDPQDTFTAVSAPCVDCNGTGAVKTGPATFAACTSCVGTGKASQ